MGLHNVKVIYPGYKSFEFKRYGNDDWDYFWQTFKDEWRSNSPSACAMFKDANIRSFSVNDFVKVDDTYYRCMCPGGMVEVSEEFVNEIEDRIRNHYLVKERDEYFWAKLEVFEELESTKKEVLSSYECAKV